MDFLLNMKTKQKADLRIMWINKSIMPYYNIFCLLAMVSLSFVMKVRNTGRLAPSRDYIHKTSNACLPKYMTLSLRGLVGSGQLMKKAVLYKLAFAELLWKKCNIVFESRYVLVKPFTFVVKLAKTVQAKIDVLHTW